MLIDDHPPTRDGVSRLLAGQPDMRVVGSFRESRAAVRFAAREAPDVAGAVRAVLASRQLAHDKP